MRRKLKGRQKKTWFDQPCKALAVSRAGPVIDAGAAAAVTDTAAQGPGAVTTEMGAGNPSSSPPNEVG